MIIAVEIPVESLKRFCRKWGIQRVALFGSVLRADFGPGSDVDVLVDFQAGAMRSLLDLAEAEEELSSIFGRPVDLVDRKSIERSENWIRRRDILGSATIVYEE